MATVALVGAAHIHTPGFVKKMADRPDVNVKCVWDHDAERAKKNADPLDARVVDSVEQIIGDDEITAAVICSETNRHVDLVEPLAKAGKHLFVEKPLAADAASSHAMARAIREAGVLFQTGYFMRGNPVSQFIKQEIEAGHFGKVTRVRHNNCHHGSIGGWFDTDWRWMADPAIAGVGGFGDLGTHSLDILLWWMGPAERCTADINVVLGNYGDCDESGEGLIKFANGAVGTLGAGWVDVADPVKLLVYGTEGMAYQAGGKLYYKSNHVEGAEGGEWTDLPDAWPHAFDLFLDAINGAKDVPLVPVEEAAHCAAVMEALYKGAEQKAWVEPA